MARGRELTRPGAISLLVQALDLIGTFAFAISGATEGIRHRFDLFGVMVLAFVTAATGGILRDLLIGAVPPAAIADRRYLVAALLAGLVTFCFSGLLRRLHHPVQIFDAAGLALFAVVGTSKALVHGVDWPIAAVLGMLSGVGGGILRDVLCAKVPGVLRAEFYAVAALAGGLVVAVGSLLPIPRSILPPIGAALCFVLRLVGIHRRWRLPVARP